MERSEQTRLLARKLIAILVVFCILFAHSVVAGSNVVIAMEEALENQETITKGENIKFDAFFASDNILHEKELNINELQTLNLQIAVKDKYSLSNATIKIEDPNFSINKDELKKNKYLGKVNTKTNEIEIKNISSNNTALIELPINFKRQEKIDSGYFDKEIEIKINGKYLNEDQEEKDVEGMVKIKPIWTANEDVNIKQSISKYFSLGEKGTLLEQEIEAEVANNTVPVKSEVVQTQIPMLHDKKPESIVVLINGERVNNENVRYNNQGILRFEYTNTDEEIKWEEEAKENKRTYTVVYRYSDTAELTETPISLKTMVASSLYTVKDNIVKEDSQELTVAPIGNMVTVNTELAGNIYKGYLYENEDKSIDYIEKNDITVSYVEGIDNIALQTNNNIYINEQGAGLIPAENIMYKQTKFNKEELINVLGEEGKVTIKDAEGNVIAEVTKDTEADEEGIIRVKYEDGQKGISIETTKPQVEGKITVLNTKLVNGVTNQSRRVIKLIKQLVASPEVTTNMTKESTTANMELKESTTEAKLEVGTNSLSTTQENEDVEIKATLKSNSQEQDLYMNPSIIIEFPVDVQEVKVNSINKIFGDEFAQIRSSQGIIDGKQAVRIDLEGEQKGHKEAGTEGTVIDINANLKLNDKAISKQDTIKMTYTNAKANQYKDGQANGTEETSIDIVSPKSLITTNDIEALGITTKGEDEGIKKSIPINAEAKVLPIQSSVTNNNSTEIQDVKILGTFGTKGTAKIGGDEYENNIDAVLRSPLVVEGIDPNEVRIYYSENESATDDVEDVNNRWQSEIGNPGAIKKYLIQTSKMDVGQEIKVGYNIEVPANLQYKQSMYQGYSVTYNDNQTNKIQEVKATTIALKTAQGPELSANLTATVGQDNLSNETEVKRGEVIEYNVELKNTGDEDLTGVQMTANVPDGTVLLADEYNGTFGMYKELEDRTVQIQIPEIKVGEKVDQKIKVKVLHDAVSTSKISEQVIVNYNNTQAQSNQIDLTVGEENDGIEIRTQFEQLMSSYALVGEETTMNIMVTNTTQETIKNVKVAWNLPEQIELLYMWKMNDNNRISENTYTIDEIGPNQNILIFGRFKINGTNEIKSLSVNSQLEYNNNIYRANGAKIKVEQDKGLSIKLTSDVESGNVNPGQKINFTIEVKNESEIQKNDILIKDELPYGMILLGATQTNEAGETTDLEISGNKFSTRTNFEADETKKIILKTMITNDYNITNDIQMKNKAILEKDGVRLNETSEITYTLKAPTPTTPPTAAPTEDPGENPTTAPTENPGGNPTVAPSGNPGGNPTIAPSGNPGITPTENPGGNPGTDSGDEQDYPYQEPEEQTTISGYAWVDGDLNGAKDSYENTVENMDVKLLDVETNEFATDEEGNEIQGTTDSTGKYVLEDIPAGEYIAVFEYDTAMYKVTAYQKAGVDPSKNSKAISKGLDLDGEEKIYGITDVLKVEENDNISDINIGLVTTGKFDFELKKYINSIYVLTSDGDIKEYNYDKETLAKVELDRKKMEDADIIIEYYLEVRNVGEVSGYVKTIEDYLPQDLVFSSEMNYDWYQTGATLRTNSLQDLAIAPGDSEIVPLILTKRMTDDNTGIMGNTAEIIEAYNEEGTEDINSVPGNGDKNENDYSGADLIVSVKTGSGVVYTSLALVVVVITGLGIYFIRKKVLNTNKIRRKI